MEKIVDYPGDEKWVWEGEDEENAFFEMQENNFWDEREEWTDEDEAGLEEWEERKRQRIAEANEY